MAFLKDVQMAMTPLAYAGELPVWNIQYTFLTLAKLQLFLQSTKK